MHQVFGDSLKIEVVQLGEFQCRIIRRIALNDLLNFKCVYPKQCVSDFLLFASFGRYSNSKVSFKKCLVVFDTHWDISGFKANIENRRHSFSDQHTWRPKNHSVRSKEKFIMTWNSPSWTTSNCKLAPKTWRMLISCKNICILPNPCLQSYKTTYGSCGLLK